MRMPQRYQLGNYIVVNDLGDAKIINMSYSRLTVLLTTGEEIDLEYDKIRPIILTEEVLNKEEFSLIRCIEYELHSMVSYEIKINGKMHYLRGFVVNAEYLWSFNTLTFRYLHQLQNIISIIEPGYDLKGLEIFNIY